MAPRNSVQDDTAVAERRRAGRRKRYALRAGLWRLSSLKSVKGCGRNAVTGGGGVALVRSGNTAGYEGVQLCSNLWSCPCCSARIRQTRALDVEAVGVAHLNAGRGLYFLTLTMPHDATDALADLLDTILEAWRDVQQRKGFRELRARYGLAFIRATEITYTAPTDDGAGWHPHNHLLLFTERVLTEDERADLLGKVHGWWSHAITRRGYRAPSEAHGVNLRDVHGAGGAAGLAQYLTKVQDNYGDSWNVGTEMLRGDLKSGRRALAVTPFDLAAQALGQVEDRDGSREPARPERVVLWHEYEQATRGRKAIHWSKGLRARYLDALEQADEEVPEVPLEEALVVAHFDAATWRRLCARTWVPAALLDYAEAGRYDDLDDLVSGVLADEHWLRKYGARVVS